MIDARAFLVSANPDFYRDVYAVLVELGGANINNRADFVHHYTTNPEACEWRFCGRFGFGGKFYRCWDRCYVSMYSEDRTPEITTLLDALNQQIAALVIKHQPPAKT